MPKPKQPHHKITDRWRKRLLRWAVALVLVGSFVALSLTVLFPATRCAVDGTTRYSAEDFARAMALSSSKYNLFRLDKPALARLAREKLPYAKIEKLGIRLPNTIVVTLTEHEAFFAQRQGKQWWLLAESGKLLEIVGKAPAGLLTIEGAALRKPVAGQKARWVNSFTRPADLKALLTALRESELWDCVTGLRVSNYAVPDFIYKGRVRVRFGPASAAQAADPDEALRDKLLLAGQTLAQLDAQNPACRGDLDLSIPNRADFTPRIG